MHDGYRNMTTTQLSTARQTTAIAHLGNIALYTMALLLVMAAPLLGVAAAAFGAWQAIVAGSLLYLAPAVIIVLIALSILQSHKKGDLALLALVLTATAGWFMIEAQTRAGLLEWSTALPAHRGLLIGLLVLMVVALALIYAYRFNAARAIRSGLREVDTRASATSTPERHDLPS